MNTVTAYELRQMILGDDELALLDAREVGTFHDSHCAAFSNPHRLSRIGEAANAWATLSSSPVGGSWRA